MQGAAAGLGAQLSSAQPCSALLSSALISPAQPCSALLSSARPCSALLSSAQHCSALLGPARPCSALLSSAQPCSALLGPARPCSALLSPAQPCSALLSPAQPCSALLSSAQHCSALLSTAQPCSAQLSPSTARCCSCTATSIRSVRREHCKWAERLANGGEGAKNATLSVLPVNTVNESTFSSVQLQNLTFYPKKLPLIFFHFFFKRLRLAKFWIFFAPEHCSKLPRKKHVSLL